MPTRALRIQVQRGAQLEDFEIHAEHALLGSGAHCDVRLRPTEAAFEQLVFELHGDSVLGLARSHDPPCSLDGSAFREGHLASGSVLQLGALRVSIELIDGQRAAAKPARSGSLPPALQALGLIAVAVGLYYALQEPEPSSALAADVALPVLFQARQSTCPQHDATAALALAQQTAQLAAIKRERSPFYAQDAVAAVPLYDRAAACFRAAAAARAGANAAPDAASNTQLAASPALDSAASSARNLSTAEITRSALDAEQAADELRTALRDELRVRQVRLERFVAQQRYSAAQAEIRVLRELVRHTGGAYAQWLGLLQHELEARSASADEQGS